MHRKELTSLFIRNAVFVVFVLFPLVGAFAQVPNQLNTGYPENGLFHGSEIDNVQVNNGGLHVEVPVSGAKGRGLSTGSKLIYNSKSWTFFTHCYTSGGGFCQDTVQGDVLSNPVLAFYSAFDYQFAYSSNVCQRGLNDYLTKVGGYTLREPDGTKHHFAPDPYQLQSQCVPTVYPGTLYADDGSGWIMQLNTSDGSIVEAISKSGTRIIPETNSPGAWNPAILIVDVNGNQMSANPVCCNTTGAGGTDTLGRSVPANGGYYDSSGTLRLPSLGVGTSVAIQTSLCRFSNADSCLEKNTTWTLPTQLQLPNGDTFSFTYAQNGGGELSSMTLPTGGQISWTWGAWDMGGRNVATRTVSANGVSGTWTYNFASAPPVITVTDPVNKDTRYTCIVWDSGCVVISQVDYFDGPAGSSPIIKTISTDHTSVGLSPAPAAPYYLPIRETTTWSQQNLVSKTETDWETKVVSGVGTVSWRNPSEQRAYDWGTGAPGVLLRRTDSAYRHLESDGQAYLSANIADLPTLVQTYDGAGNLVAQSKNTYDSSALTSTGTCSAPGVYGHDYCNFGTGNVTRGNVTTIGHWLGRNNTWLNATHTYDDLGNVLSTTDPLGNTTTVSFTDNWNDSSCVGATPTRAFPTLVTDALGHRVKTSYFTCTSLLQSAQDENDLVAGRAGMTHTYDLMNRPLCTNLPDQGQTCVAYNDVAPMTITKTVKATPQPDIVSSLQLDGLGRSAQSQRVTPGGTVLADITYDSLGRVSTVSNPYYQGSNHASDPTYGLTTSQYDALSRVTQVTKQDGSSSTASYSGNCTTNTDEAGKKRTACSDGLGRLTSVFEDPSTLNYETDYQYDALGNLLRVDQKGSAPSDSTQWRTRTFTYDSLSRLLTANNPESGTINYAYDANGNLTAKKDARSVTTNFTYDALNRMTGKTYTDATFGAGYTYDQSGVWGTPGNNAIGRMVLAYDGHFAATLFSYDSMGRVSQQWDCPPSAWVNGGCPSVTASYNLAGNLTQLTYPDGRVVTNNYNSGDQLDQVQVGGTNYWSVVDTTDFYPNGTPKKATLGNGVAESMVLNQRLQPQQDTVSNSTIATKPFADHLYNYGTQNNGNVLSVTDQLNQAPSPFTQTYTYDQLNRLATANESRWGLSFTYDAWANRLQQAVTAGSAGQLAITVDGNNRIQGALVPCTAANAYCYDAAGNLLNDNRHQYTFDGASRISQVDNGATQYTYDPVVDRVRKDTGTNFTEYYHFGGNVLAEQDQAGHWSDYIYAGSKRIAKADLFDTRLHVSATTCNGCTGAYEVMNFSNIGDLNGHVIQSGEKLFVRQLIPTGMSGGVGFCFTDATCMVWYPAVVDQNGQLASWAAGTGSWQYRRIDLTPIAGHTINNAYMEIITKADGQPWNVYFDDVVVQWADGTVHPLYTRESSLATSQYGTGQTNPTTVVETSTASGDVSNPAQTTYYYHGDQIGSSRLMTSGSGWPVWQRTFLPYGEEYSAPQMGTNHYKFTGKERDDESLLDYFGARYYSSGLGRFITPDWAAIPAPVPYADFEDPQSLNIYGYGRNNPTNHLDADGHDITCSPVDQKGTMHCVVKQKIEPPPKLYNLKRPQDYIWWEPPRPKQTVRQQLVDLAGQLLYFAGVSCRTNGPECAGPLGITPHPPQVCNHCAIGIVYPFGGFKSPTRWANQMAKRGWTSAQIEEAVQSGQKFPAPNNINPGNGATRYVHPTTGRSVVLDNATKEVIHVGGDGFKY